MSFWRKENPVLDEHGNILVGGMWEHQREAWNATEFIKAVITGVGGGKTFFGGKRGISLAMHNAPVPFMYVSPSYKQAKRTIIPTLEALLDGRKLRYSYNKSDNKFVIRGGRGGYPATIWIGSGEDPKSLKGSNLCAAGIDEPFIQAREVFLEILARVRDPRASLREIFLTGTPEDLNWGYDICEGEDRDNYDIKVIHASSRANLALPSSFLETLQSGYDDKMRDAYLDGKFVNMSRGRIYYGFERERNVLSIPDPGGDLYLGLDFNVNPMAGIIFFTKGNKMHIMEEILLANSDTEEMVNEACRRYPGRIKTAFPDPSGNSRKTSAPGGKTDFTIIKQSGITVKSRVKAPTRRDRYNCANRRFQDNETPLTIDPSCKKTIQGFEKLTHEGLKQMEELTHPTDAATYPVEYLFPIKQRIQQARLRI